MTEKKIRVGVLMGGASAGLTFSAATYPGLNELLASADDGFGPLQDTLKNTYGVTVQAPQDLNGIIPGLGDAVESVLAGNDPARGLFASSGFRPSVTEMLIEL